MAKQSEAALNYMLESVKKFVPHWILSYVRAIWDVFWSYFICYALAVFLIWEMYETCTN